MAILKGDWPEWLANAFQAEQHSSFIQALLQEKSTLERAYGATDRDFFQEPERVTPTGRFFQFEPELQPLQEGARRVMAIDPAGADGDATGAVLVDFSDIEARILAFYSIQNRATTTVQPDSTPDDMSVYTIERILEARRKLYDMTPSTISWSERGPVVHAQGLRKWGACHGQLTMFERLHGHTLIIDDHAITLLGEYYNGSWFLSGLVESKIVLWDRAHKLRRILPNITTENWAYSSGTERTQFWRGILWLLWETQNPYYHWRWGEALRNLALVRRTPYLTTPLA